MTTTDLVKKPHKKTFQGVVVSTKNAKTIVVKVEKTLPHSFYKKNITQHRKYHAHDENQLAKEGQTVRIVSCRPYSLLKKWRLLEIINK